VLTGVLNNLNGRIAGTCTEWKWRETMGKWTHENTRETMGKWTCLRGVTRREQVRECLHGSSGCHLV